MGSAGSGRGAVNTGSTNLFSKMSTELPEGSLVTPEVKGVAKDERESVVLEEDGGTDGVGHPSTTYEKKEAWKDRFKIMLEKKGERKNMNCLLYTSDAADD